MKSNVFRTLGLAAIIGLSSCASVKDTLEDRAKEVAKEYRKTEKKAKREYKKEVRKNTPRYIGVGFNGLELDYEGSLEPIKELTIGNSYNRRFKFELEASYSRFEDPPDLLETYYLNLGFGYRLIKKDAINVDIGIIVPFEGYYEEWDNWGTMKNDFELVTFCDHVPVSVEIRPFKQFRNLSFSASWKFRYTYPETSKISVGAKFYIGNGKKVYKGK